MKRGFLWILQLLLLQLLNLLLVRCLSRESSWLGDWVSHLWISMNCNGIKAQCESCVVDLRNYLSTLDTYLIWKCCCHYCCYLGNHHWVCLFSLPCRADKTPNFAHPRLMGSCILWSARWTSLWFWSSNRRSLDVIESQSKTKQR